jgi:TRAP transporter 4TM/12TM fusion protein
MTRYRKLNGPARWYFMGATWLGVLLTIYFVFRMRIGGYVIFDGAFYGLILAVYLPLAFLVFPARARSGGNLPWYDILLAVLSAIGPLLVFIFGVDLLASSWTISPPPAVFAVGLITWILILEALRRSTGLVLMCIIAVFSIYPLFASHLPSILFAKSYSLERLVGYFIIGQEGIYGLPWQTFANVLVGFMIFGVALQVTGGAKFLLDTAIGLVGRYRGAPALTAVVGSSFMASLSGSAVANVVSIGTITIPAMKKLGYPAHVAAGIESVASTGGVLMPPVMGATAFVMAALMRVPYFAVCIAAAIPMVIYYVSVFAQVYFYANRRQIPAFSPSEIPSLKKTLKTSWFFLGSIVVLIYLLFWIRVEAWAPYYGTIFLIFCAFIRKETRPNLHTLAEFTKEVGHTLSELAPTLAGVGLLLGGLSVTGVGQSLAGELIKVANGNLYLLLILGALGGLILGTGMTMTPCYIFMAIIFVPTLLPLGVNAMAANFFFLYWGMISFITPPVCIAVFAAAAIANANSMKTGLQAVRLGIVSFIIPFFFVLHPALLAQGTLAEVAQATVFAIIGTILVAGAVEGYMFKVGNLGVWFRVVMFIGGVFLMYGTAISALIGGVLGAAAIILAFARSGLSKKRQEAPT